MNIYNALQLKKSLFALLLKKIYKYVCSFLQRNELELKDIPYDQSIAEESQPVLLQFKSCAFSMPPCWQHWPC